MDFLEELDIVRFNDPEQVIERAESCLEELPLAGIPLLLGVVASAWRLLHRLDDAQHAICVGIEIAERQENYFALGDLIQRLSYIYADRGQHYEALEIAERAMRSYVLSGDAVRIGQTLVDQAVFSVHLGRHARAITFYSAALRYLPGTEYRNRLAAFQGIGHCYHMLGDLKRARNALVQARRVVTGRSVSRIDLARLVWLQGSIAAGLGKVDDAIIHLRDAIAMFRPLYPDDATLATIDLLRLLVQAGRIADAHETARAMTTLVGASRKNHIVARAITDLIRCSLEGHRLTIALVDDVAKRIQKGQERRTRRRPSQRVLSPPYGGRWVRSPGQSHPVRSPSQSRNTRTASQDEGKKLDRT